MRLDEFPNVLRILEEINNDQPYPDGETGEPIVNEEVPKEWLDRFKYFESVLIALGEKTPHMLGVAGDDLSDVICVRLPAWVIIASPGNEDDVLILKAMGCDESQVSMCRDICNEFFDGEELNCLRRNFDDYTD